MKDTFKFIILVTLAFIGMQSCIYDEEPTNTLPQGIQVGFTVHVGGNKSASRGAGDGIEEGIKRENMIDIENRDFRVYLFKATDDNQYIGELKVISVLNVTDSDEEGYNNDYYVVGQVDDTDVETINGGFRLVVMANLNKWVVEYANNLDSYNFEAFQLEDKLIPMWGSQTYTDVTLKENTITNLDTPLNMLRTLAKIEIINGLELETIDKVEITKHRSQVNIPHAKDQAGNTNLDFEAPVVAGDIIDSTPLLFVKEGTKFITYLPEMEADDNPDIQITVKWDNESKVLTFPVSSEGTEETRIPILRNHIYRYTIQDIAVTPLIYYQVVSWSEHNIKIEFN